MLNALRLLSLLFPDIPYVVRNVSEGLSVLSLLILLSCFLFGGLLVLGLEVTHNLLALLHHVRV